MSYDKYRDRLDHILSVARSAGGAGIEPEVCMLGSRSRDPEALRDALDREGLKLGALCLSLGWRLGKETDEEHAEADRVINYLRQFPGTVLTLVQHAGPDRSGLAERQANALANFNAVGRRAFEQGIVCAVHPNSPAGSIFRTRDDYGVLLEGLDPRYCGYAPDTGHIAKGGMDAGEIIRAYRPLIRHVHYKDMDKDGSWTALGQGCIDHKAITRYLRDTDYDGWIMVEEESAAAEADPDRVTAANGEYVTRALKPIIA
ncbi:sugar phosphate isomerase/epimerase family protein [Paenibacillus humicola]|uniref:sugar phosphate isomerase/epimerase family protein n=1 Tax=Paenibacillus humicola TaxID=3110540 RepID=UPI00237C2B61|nr:sugar phosphate isomerase/epimerase [Paenibacillus humicola]